ncbi:MAG: hypothetical protein K2R98_16705 [Gemmataceae bacterium]|nr:hypothetical protein [Gemmataceae bacterium]
MTIRNYQPNDEAAQVAVYNEAAFDLPKYKPATIDEVRRRCKAKDFDPGTRFYAEEGSKVVGYCTFQTNGRVGYPWVLKGHEAQAEPLFQAVLAEVQKRGIKTVFAAYRNDWALVNAFFQGHGFKPVREIVNFVVDIVEMPTPAARPSLPFAPLRREDVQAIFELAPEALRSANAQELEKHLFENPYFGPDSCFVLKDKAGGKPAAVGILIHSPGYADPKQVDANMPCFRLGTFGAEGMTAKRVNGLFSFLARPGRETGQYGLDLLGHAAFLMEDSPTAWLAAQVPSDAPHLLRFYQHYFRRQGSFPIFERSL